MKKWGEKWTEKDLQYLKNNIDKSDKELAKELKRTEGAIYIQKIKIKKNEKEMFKSNNTGYKRFEEVETMKKTYVNQRIRSIEALVDMHKLQIESSKSIIKELEKEKDELLKEKKEER